MVSSTLLTLLLVLPVVTSVALLLVPGSARSLQYSRGLGSTALSTLLSFLLRGSQVSVAGGLRHVRVVPLIPTFPFPVRFGVDGLSLPFIPLTTLFTYLCVLSLSSETPRLREALISLLAIQGAVSATFLALDLFAFFVCFERTLIPIYFLVLLWGSRERRVRASYRISLYTLAGSIFRFFNLLYLASKTGTTDLELLLTLALGEEDQRFLWLTFFLAFAAKIPLFPLHIWLPEAHVEAPTIGSVLLAVLLLKLGTYGLIRFSLPLFPEGSAYFGPLVTTFAIRGILYTCLTARRQIDLKKLIAYSSVGHINVVLLGIRSETQDGIVGALVQILSHGIVSGALFFCVGVIYERYSVRSLKYFGGLAHLYPLLTRLFLAFSLANIAFPLTSSFVGEFLIFLGVAQYNRVATVVASTSRVLGAVYTLWAFNRLFFGNLRSLSIVGGQDLTRKEVALFTPLVIALLGIGIVPSSVIERFTRPVRNVLEHARRGRILTSNSPIIFSISEHNNLLKLICFLMKVTITLFSSVSISARELRTFRILGGSLDSLGIGVTTAVFQDASNQPRNTVRVRIILAWEGSSSERREILRRSFLALPTRLGLSLQIKVTRSRAGARLRHPYLRHPTLSGLRSLARGETFMRDILLQQNTKNVSEADYPLVSQTAIVSNFPALLQGINQALQEVSHRSNISGRTLLTPLKDPVASASEGEAIGRPQRRVVLVHFPSLGGNSTGSTIIFRAQSVPNLLSLPKLPLNRNPSKKVSESFTREQNFASLTHLPSLRSSQRPSL